MTKATAKSNLPKPARRRKASPKSDFARPVNINRSERGIGHVQCQVTNTSQVYHSSLERIFVLLFGLHPDCTDLRTQPETITYKLGDVDHRYTADCLVKLDGKPAFLAEIKPERDIRDPDNAEKWDAISKAASAMGLGFKLFSDTYLQQEPRHSTVHRLQAYRSNAVDGAIKELIDAALLEGGPQTMGALRDLAMDSLLVRDTILTLMIKRHLTTDLNQPIDDTSIIRFTRKVE